MNTPNDSPPDLDDGQRKSLVEFFQTNPDCGYKRAVRSLGGPYARATKAEALAIVEADDDLVEASQRALRLDKPTLLKAVGEIVADHDHKDRLRAITFALSAIHGMSEQRGHVEVEHTGRVQIEKREVSLTGVLHVLAEAGALPDELAGPLRALAAARDVLPAQPD